MRGLLVLLLQLLLGHVLRREQLLLLRGVLLLLLLLHHVAIAVGRHLIGVIGDRTVHAGAEQALLDAVRTGRTDAAAAVANAAPVAAAVLVPRVLDDRRRLAAAIRSARRIRIAQSTAANATDISIHSTSTAAAAAMLLLLRQHRNALRLMHILRGILFVLLPRLGVLLHLRPLALLLHANHNARGAQHNHRHQHRQQSDRHHLAAAQPSRRTDHTLRLVMRGRHRIVHRCRGRRIRHIHLALVAPESGRTHAMETVHAIHARAAILARRRLALVNVHAAVAPREARPARAPIVIVQIQTAAAIRARLRQAQLHSLLAVLPDIPRHAVASILVHHVHARAAVLAARLGAVAAAAVVHVEFAAHAREAGRTVTPECGLMVSGRCRCGRRDRRANPTVFAPLRRATDARRRRARLRMVRRLAMRRMPIVLLLLMMMTAAAARRRTTTTTTDSTRRLIAQPSRRAGRTSALESGARIVTR